MKVLTLLDDLGVLERGDDRRPARRGRRVEPERRAAGDLSWCADELPGHHEGPGRILHAGTHPGPFGLYQEAGDVGPGVMVEADHARLASASAATAPTAPGRAGSVSLVL